MEFQIRKAREKAGFSQKELAEIVGVKPTTFNGYESGKHDPKSDLLVKIANAIIYWMWITQRLRQYLPRR